MEFHNKPTNDFPMQRRTNEAPRGSIDTFSSQEENEENKINLRSLIERRLKNSSVYAVAKIGQSQSTLRRFMWLLAIIIGLMGCALQIYRFLSLYFKYPIIVNLEVERKIVLDFPAVTICSLNAVSYHLDDCAGRDASKWYCKEYTVTSNSLQISNGYIKFDDSPLDKSLNNSIIILESDDKNKNTDAVNLEITAKITPTNIFNKTNQYRRQRPNSKYTRKFSKGRSEKYQKILNTKVFIQSCYFNGESCPAKYFNRFRSLKYGDCYTFKSVDNHGESLKISKTGINSGLELELNMEYGYETQQSDSVGARVAIHDRTELPDLEGNGLSLTPGFETSISLRQTLIHRLPSPFKDKCVHYKTGSRYYQTDQNDCMFSCVQEWNNKICGCSDPSLPMKSDFVHCDTTNVSLSSCLKFIYESATVRETCDCPLPCISKSYDEIMSKALWPTENLLRMKSFQEIEQFRRTHAKVKVYYSTLEQSIFQQKPMFQESELFSHLGGELGLWLGLSLIALFEIMESLICFLRFLVRYCCTSKKELFY